MSKWVLLLAVVLGVAALAVGLLAQRSPAPPSPPAPTPTHALTPASGPRLTGRAPSEPDDAARAEPLAPWLETLTTASDEGQVEEAFKHLHARLKDGDVALDELLDVALLADGGGQQSRLRKLALRRLKEHGAAALPLLGRLFDLLEGDDEHARKVAVSVVANIGGREGVGMLAMPLENGAPPAAEALLPFLPRIRAILAAGGVDPQVRLAMLPLLRALGPRAADTAPALVAWIQEIEKDREEIQRANPGTHFSWFHHEFRIQETLSRLGPDVLPVVLSVLREEDPYGEYPLYRVIEEMGPEANEALRALLDDEDPRVRANALNALATNGEGEAATLTLLRRFLGDDEAKLRALAVSRLPRYGAEVGPDLIQMLSDPDDDVREAAARGLRAVPEAAVAALPRLLDLMRNGTFGERLNTMGTVAKIGPAAAAATPDILDLLAQSIGFRGLGMLDTDSYVASIAAFGEAARPHLIEAVRSSNLSRREAAIHALHDLEGVTEDVVAPLANLLPEREGVERMRLAGLLAAHDHPAAARFLVEGLGHEERAVRTAAADALQKSAAETPEALPALVEGLIANDALLHADGAVWHEEWDHFYAYRLAVERVGQHAPEALVSLVDHEHEDVSEAASKGIALAAEAGLDVLDRAWPDIAPAGRARLVLDLAHPAFGDEPSPRARARVVGALDDPDPRVRFAAARVVRGDDLQKRAIEVFIELLPVTEGDVGKDAAWRLRQLGSQVAPWRESLAAAKARTKGTTSRWVQDTLDAIDDDR